MAWRLPRPIFVGEKHKAVPGAAEGDAFEWIRERFERYFKLPAVEESVKRRLKQTDSRSLKDVVVGFGRIRGFAGPWPPAEEDGGFEPS